MANEVTRQDADSGPREFRRTTTSIALSLLTNWVGQERAQEAVGRISSAIAASASAARNPKDFYTCTPASIGTCVAVAALTGIMPGVGSSALAYVIPRRPRRGEQPQLQYQLSHRGLNALARRCGQTMVAIPIGFGDKIVGDENGDVRILERDLDNPPQEWAELRGVVVVVKQIVGGMPIARQFVPRAIIEKRRSKSDSFSGQYAEYSPWSTWPVEMAMKTAMHYAIGRGWCVIDDTEAARALAADAEPDIVQTVPADTVTDERPKKITDVTASLDAVPAVTIADEPSGDDVREGLDMEASQDFAGCDTINAAGSILEGWRTMKLNAAETALVERLHAAACDRIRAGRGGRANKSTKAGELFDAAESAQEGGL